ncbi:hypothetical protein ISS07_02780 [Candidatus Woesearchaeota archaeon]|nr:hypothetical protein [Candidatus Woesearchaeota archaeon]
MESLIQELRNKLQVMEWDMSIGRFNEEKMPYYEAILERYEKLKTIYERV